MCCAATVVSFREAESENKNGENAHARLANTGTHEIFFSSFGIDISESEARRMRDEECCDLPRQTANRDGGSQDESTQHDAELYSARHSSM